MASGDQGDPNRLSMADQRYVGHFVSDLDREIAYRRERKVVNCNFAY
jgi:hypothetical protein